MTTPVRRSGRKRKANQNYVVDNWDDDALDLIQSSDSERSRRHEAKDSSDVDEDYIDLRSNVQPDGGEITGDGDSVLSTTASEKEIDNEKNDGGSNQEKPVTKAAVKKKSTGSKANNIKRIQWKKTSKEHSRGLANIDRKSGKISIYQDTFGPSAPDIQQIIQARDLWGLKARDVTLPSRQTLREAFEKHWHDNADPSRPNRFQVVTAPLSASELERFLPKAQAQIVVLGPHETQRQYELDFLQSIDFGKAWEPTTELGSSGTIQQKQNGLGRAGKGENTKGQSNIPQAQAQSRTRFHEGWLLNAGGTVKSLAWRPCDGSGKHYLAVACRKSFEPGTRSQPSDENKSEAFSPSLPYPSSIQIWQVASSRSGMGAETLDFDTKPRVCGIIATEFGQIRQLAWLPPNAYFGTEVNNANVDNLVCLSSDGRVRIIEVPRFPGEHHSSELIGSLATTKCCITPPDGAVFTTFTLPSSNEIIVGGSDGYVKIYNLAQLPAAGEIKPYMSLQLHHTYILQLCTAGKDELSHFLASTSAAGDLKLTDLRSPYQESITVPRTRLPSDSLVYCPLSQSFITTVNHSGRTEVFSTKTTVAALQLRHFYSQVILTKFPNNNGTASALAGSQHHPYILVGNTQGTVLCQNILRRLLPRSGGWVQRLCEYEWIPVVSNDETNGTSTSTVPSPQQLIETQNEATPQSAPRQTTNSTSDRMASSDPSNRSMNTIYHGHKVRHGISRFREGFILERPDLSPGSGQLTKLNVKNATPKKVRGKSSDKSTTKAEPKRKSRKADIDASTDPEVMVVDDFDDVIDVDDDDDNNNNDDNEDDNENEDIDTAGDLESRSRKPGATETTTDEMIIAEVIFEEEQAVTAISWYEDVRCASWAAIGWGSGIIRIQDLSHDTE